MPVTVKVVIDRMPTVLKGIEAMTGTQVLVGIPEDKTTRTDGRATNALIGYVHEVGSAARNIPARPWLVPGVQQAVPNIVRAQQGIASSAINGKVDAVEQGSHAVGLIAQNAVRAMISSNIPPPLKPATIRARQRRSKGSSYRRKATSAIDVTTLVDSGQLRASISYVVRKTQE
jgi:hypothetical protein